MTDTDQVWAGFPDNGCFGCSPSRPDGLQIKFQVRGDRIVADYAIRTGFHGAPGIAHGGIVATVFDEICCAAAFRHFGGFVVTGELGVRYTRPVPVEAVLHWESHVASTAHPRYVVVEARAEDGGIEVARATAKIFRNERVVAP